MTKRSGVYGATIAEAETIATLEMNEDSQLVQVHSVPCFISSQPKQCERPLSLSFFFRKSRVAREILYLLVIAN